MPQTDEHLQGQTATTPSWPAEVDPWRIAEDPKLSHDAKLERLRQLEWDVRLVENALEEGMTGDTRLPPLAEVLAALEHLVGHEVEGAGHESPSKI